MYAYIDRKKITCYYFIPCNWFERDKDILEILTLLKKLKFLKQDLKKNIGRKLAARVLKHGMKIS
jgi:DNA-directed RNA polymerase subunit beta